MNDTKIEDAIVEAAPAQEQMQINLDAQTAMTIKVQEFDKNIAEAESVVYDLKKQRAAYIYDQNVQQIVTQHKQQMIKNQIEEETKKKLAEQK